MRLQKSRGAWPAHKTPKSDWCQQLWCHCWRVHSSQGQKQQVWSCYHQPSDHLSWAISPNEEDQGSLYLLQFRYLCEGHCSNYSPAGRKTYFCLYRSHVETNDLKKTNKRPVRNSKKSFCASRTVCWIWENSVSSPVCHLPPIFGKFSHIHLHQHQHCNSKTKL